MIENLQKWMYINDVQNDKLLEVAKIIEQENKEPVIFTAKGEILYYFYKLINWKIKIEDFFQFNDIYFNKKLYNYKFLNWVDAVEYIKNWKKSNKKIYVLDSLFLQDLVEENVYFI